MVIQHNMNAMNADRQLRLVTGGLSKSTEKLSSGYQINRAADDAAGLSISEKMRKQVRGLSQASQNIEDGISLCQVADGALHETVDVLQRMRELAVQSANGTNAEIDRQCIEEEIAQLRNEIDRIAETTKFNDVVYPLNAAMADQNIDGTKEIIGIKEITFVLPGNYPNDGLIREGSASIRTTIPVIYDSKKYNAGDTIIIEGLTTNGNAFQFNGGSMSPFNVGYWNNSNGGNLGPLRKSDLRLDKDGYIYYLGNLGVEQYVGYVINPDYMLDGINDPIHATSKAILDFEVATGWSRFMTIADLGSQIKLGTKVELQTRTKLKTAQTGSTFHHSGGFIDIQAGASSVQADKIRIPTVNATCKGLGILDVRLVTEESATAALDILDNAISKAAFYRSMFGASQNRLEHAQKIDDNTVENTQAAESIIRDTDMAKEMVRYSNAFILAQAGQTMLSQANQSNEGVLSLIA